jgi:hypothetical protein
MAILSSTGKIDARDGDVFHIQPAIPLSQACSIVLMIVSNGEGYAIDFRRISRVVS